MENEVMETVVDEVVENTENVKDVKTLIVYGAGVVSGIILKTLYAPAKNKIKKIFANRKAKYSKVEVVESEE